MSFQLPRFEYNGKSLKDPNDYEQAGLGGLLKVLIERESINDDAPVRNEYPEEVLKAPGLIGEIATYISASAVRKSPVLSLAGAIATVAAASANKYVVDGWDTRLNVYITMVGVTGGGKQHPQNAAKKLAELAGFGDKTIEGVSSDAAVFRLLQAKRECLMFMDEIAHVLAASHDASKWEAAIMKALLQIYGLSGGVYSGKAYAKTDDNVESIVGPFLNVLGATTPGKFMETVGKKFVHDGLLNRFLVFRTDELERPTKPDKSPPHPALIKQLKAINNVFTPGSDKPHQIPINDDAQAELDAISGRFDDHHRNDPELGAMWSRGFENTLKLAALAALGKTDSPKSAVITPDCVKWAESLVLHSFGEMVISIETESTDSPEEKDRNDVLSYVKRVREYAKDKTYGKHCKAGDMPRGKLMRLTQLDAKRLNAAVSWLMETGQIARKEHGDGPGKAVFYAPIA